MYEERQRGRGGQKWWPSDKDSLPQQLEGRRCCQNHRHQWLCAWQSKRIRRPHPFYMLAKLYHNTFLRNDAKITKQRQTSEGPQKFQLPPDESMSHHQDKIWNCKYFQFFSRYIAFFRVQFIVREKDCVVTSSTLKKPNLYETRRQEVQELECTMTLHCHWRQQQRA
jgi:hypothetical protein